jgi:glycosyltransferase involved in cell wall biosynthesis
VLSPERGLSELVEAVGRVREDRHDALLLFLGKGAAKQELAHQVVSSKLERTVFFHDQVDYADVPRFIAACDAGVVPLPDHPQWRYQVPTKLLEYTAMQKPVVITDMMGSRWVVGDRGGVFFCGHGTPAEIRKGILNCMAAKSEISHSDRDRIVERFSSSAIADSLTQMFTTLLSERKK